MSRNNNSGCGLLIGGALILAAVLWLVGVALWVLSIAVPATGLVAGGYFFLAAHRARRDERAQEAAGEELDALKRDATFDLTEILSRWDMLIITKGIGTELEGCEEESLVLQRRLLAAKEALDVAATPAQKIEAVIHADQVRESAERFL